MIRTTKLSESNISDWMNDLANEYSRTVAKQYRQCQRQAKAKLTKKYKKKLSATDLREAFAIGHEYLIDDIYK